MFFYHDLKVMAIEIEKNKMCINQQLESALFKTPSRQRHYFTR